MDDQIYKPTQIPSDNNIVFVFSHNVYVRVVTIDTDGGTAKITKAVTAIVTEAGTRH